MANNRYFNLFFFKILGYDESDYEVCHLNFYPSNSEECKMMSFGPIEPNKHIGDVSLKPYILRSTLVDSQLKYSDNFTVLNITFTNIKWKSKLHFILDKIYNYLLCKYKKIIIKKTSFNLSIDC